MNWTLYLSIAAILLTALAAVFNGFNKKTIGTLFSILVVVPNTAIVLLHKKDVSDEVPVVRADYVKVKGFQPYIHLYIINPDNELPFKDLSFQTIDQPAINIGTLYPGNVKNLPVQNVPKENTVLITTLRYNGTEKVEVDFDMKVNLDSTVTIKGTYLRNNIEFIPEWQKRIDERNKNPQSYKLDTTQHFDPTKFQN